VTADPSSSSGRRWNEHEPGTDDVSDSVRTPSSPESDRPIEISSAASVPLPESSPFYMALPDMYAALSA
jgi:hypothetical protein